jgi:hypothetical protein
VLATEPKYLSFYLPASIARQRYTRALLRRPQHVLVDLFVEVVVQKTYRDRVAEMSGYQIQQFRSLLLWLDFITGNR